MLKRRKSPDAPRSGSPKHRSSADGITVRRSERVSEFQIHVVTDATGGLPRHVLGVLLTQFPSLTSRPRYHTYCTSTERIEKVLHSLKRKGTLVFSSLADPELKAFLASKCKSLGIAHYDLTGGCVDFIVQHTGQSPENDLTRIHACNDRYLDRIDALEFTLQHDDSRRLESIHLADIVLVGLSRVSKTPTSAYLGWLGYRVANVSFAPEIGLPSELKRCRRRVVALTIKPKMLAEIRMRRFQINGFKAAIEASQESLETHYFDLRETTREVMAADAEYRKRGYPIVETTNATVEETASLVLEALGKL